MLISQSLTPVALKNATNIAFKYLKLNVTYRDFIETCARFSYYLQKEIGHGHRVGLWMSNCPTVAYCFVALSNTKNCTVPLNPWASPSENLAKIKLAEIHTMLCTSDHLKTLREFLTQNGFGNIKIIEMESKRCAEYDKSYSPPPTHLPLEKDEILMLFTPGTTGKQKPCLFNHTAVIQAMNSVKLGYKMLPTDCFYSQKHLSTAFQFIHFLMAPLMGGASIYISDDKDFANLLPAFTEKRVTIANVDRSVLHEMIRYSEEQKIPAPTIKAFVFNGGLPEKATWDALPKMGKAVIYSVYGMTEYLGTIAMSNPDFKPTSDKPGLIGPPVLAAKTRVVDDNGDEIDKKKPQKGQILVMGPQLMVKYLNLPEEQKQTIRGTWLFTGDYVDIDKDGCVNFIDRKADLVTLDNGEKVVPRDIEEVVRQIPQVEEVAYIGTRDRLKKPVIAVAIVKKLQAELNEATVREFLAAKIDKAKMPAGIFFIEAMPKTISGAINRAKLRSTFDGA